MVVAFDLLFSDHGAASYTRQSPSSVHGESPRAARHRVTPHLRVCAYPRARAPVAPRRASACYVPAARGFARGRADQTSPPMARDSPYRYLPIEPLTALPAKSHMHAARSLDAWALFRYSVPSCAGLCAATVLSSRSALSGLTGLRAWARERLVLINVGDHFHVVESSELAMDHFHLVILL